MKRPKLVRDDSGEREGWWLGDRFVPDKPPEVDGWYRARELERELSAARAYAVGLQAAGADLYEVVRDLAHGLMPTGKRHVEVIAAWDAALAKNTTGASVDGGRQSRLTAADGSVENGVRLPAPPPHDTFLTMEIPK
jgi:hypothetical protein